EAFRGPRASFKGDRITGIGFDRAVLIQAGIERADAFIAVSSGDNSNIISARVARESFSVGRVVARIYDPRRAEVYERLGIPTVATVRWTADQMLRKIVPEGGEPLWRDPTGKIVLAEVGFSPAWIGEQVKAVEARKMSRMGARRCLRDQLPGRRGAAALPGGDRGDRRRQGEPGRVAAGQDRVRGAARGGAGESPGQRVAVQRVLGRGRRRLHPAAAFRPG